MACTGRPWSISELRCEHLRSPINIDASAPRFTWTYEGRGEPGGKQTAYQVDVATSMTALDQGKPSWTSGRVEGNLYIQRSVYTGGQWKLYIYY